MSRWDVGGADGDKIDLMQAPMMLLGSDDGEWQWWFDAPSAFRGDLSALHGGSLTYRCHPMSDHRTADAPKDWVCRFPCFLSCFF